MGSRWDHNEYKPSSNAICVFQLFAQKDMFTSFTDGWTHRFLLLSFSFTAVELFPWDTFPE